MSPQGDIIKVARHSRHHSSSQFGVTSWRNPFLAAGVASLSATARGNGNSILEWTSLGQLAKISPVRVDRGRYGGVRSDELNFISILHQRARSNVTAESTIV